MNLVVYGKSSFVSLSKGSLGPMSVIRFKRTTSRNKGSSVSPQTQRIITQLSVMSARKKQPKLLKLCKEDLVKHQTIQKAWRIYQDIAQKDRKLKLKSQYESIQAAMTTLKKLSPELYKKANINEQGKKFPMELKVPTDFPANKIWHYNYRKPISNE